MVNFCYAVSSAAADRPHVSLIQEGGTSMACEMFLFERANDGLAHIDTTLVLLERDYQAKVVKWLLCFKSEFCHGDPQWDSKLVVDGVIKGTNEHKVSL